MTARVEFDIDVREPFAGGEAFGDTGPYERIAGTVRFAIDPDTSKNAAIVDLDKTERNADGLVEYATDFYILRPSDMSRGNRRLIYDVNNRGNKRLLQFLNDAVHSNSPEDIEHAGNGFLMRRGYSIVWSGWQGDLLPGDGRLTMQLPVATDDGRPLTGPTRTEFIADEPGITCIPLSANGFTGSYRAATTDADSANLTAREYEMDERIAIPSDQWSFAREDEAGRVIDSDEHLHYPQGFNPGWIYELVYTARDPKVLGLGFTGVRDLISFLLHDDEDACATPNPLRDAGASVEAAYAWGRSQSGRFLREFVYQGFNEDGQGRQVFAGISPHVSGGGRVWLNCRFAQPGRFPRQHNDHLYPSDQFPFAYAETTDPHTGKSDAILKRPETDPLVIHTQTSSEYWDRSGSLVHTDPLGNDLSDHPRSRVYLFASSQHNADPRLGSAEGYWSSARSGKFGTEATSYPTNPLNTSALLRALIDVLDGWARDGIEPPPSMIPRRSDGTLVTAREAAAGFPNIPGIRHPESPCRLHLLDFGETYDDGIIAHEPPIRDLSAAYAVLVPATDRDGNEIGGIRTPHVEVPLATYTGWNYRAPGSSEKALKGTVGSYFPLPLSAEERASTGDERPSIQERYPTREDYAAHIEAAARDLASQRLLLDEDVERYLAAAASGADG